MKVNHSTLRDIKLVLLMTFCIVAMESYSQKGIGENDGVSRQQLNPELLKLEGIIEKTESGSRKFATGKSIKGTHLVVHIKGALVNIHLGPTSAVSKLLIVKESDLIK